MEVLLLIGIVWGLRILLNACIETARDTKRRRDAERQRAEQAKRSAELARMTAEWKQRQAEAKAEVDRLIALEREQSRQRREQERLAREQERQAQEQARQAEQLARHEQKLAELEFRLTQAEADIAAEVERIASLYALMDIATAEQAAAIPGSKTDIRAQKQIISYQSAIHAAEKRKAKAEFTKQTAQQKLSA